MTHVAAASPKRRTRERALVLVFIAGLLYASAGLFARALPFDAWTLSSWRCLVGGLFTVAFHVVETGRLHWRDYALTGAQWVLVPIMAGTTICYIVAIKVTTVADVMIVYATAPFVTALVAWAWIGERPSGRTMLASMAALLGVGVMIGGGGPPSHARILGAVLMLGMNIGMAMLLVLSRREPGRSMTPVMAVAMLAASVVSFGLAPAEAVDGASLFVMALFGVVTLGVAMQLFIAAARHAPSAEVSLIGLSDVVLGPLMVFLAFGENPGMPATIGGAIVMLAVAWSIWPDIRQAVRTRNRDARQRDTFDIRRRDDS